MDLPKIAALFWRGQGGPEMRLFGGRGMINRGSAEHVLKRQTFTGLELTSNEGVDDLGQVISSLMTKFSLL